MIVTFRDRETERIWTGEGSRRLPPWIQAGALRRLRQLNQAETLSELMVFRGNRLEALSGNRLGQYSIRVNDQWRIIFRWENSNALDVLLTDYH